MRTMFYKQQQGEKGFSLIEVLVSLSIFTIVMTISIGALMVVINANTMAQNTQAVMTNIQYALDGITREIRTGTDYYCASSATSLPVTGSTVQNCPAGGTALSFNEGGQSLTGGLSSRRIGLRLNNGTLERRLANGDGDSNVNEAGQDWIPLTSPNVRVDSLNLYVTGTTRGEGEAPTVTIFINGVAGVEDGSESEFNIQTTVVQQLFDI